MQKLSAFIIKKEKKSANICKINLIQREIQFSYPRYLFLF